MGHAVVGWRTTHIAIGIFCAVAMTIVPAAAARPIGAASRRSHANAPPPRVDLRLSTNTLTVLLSIAGISCCVAMAMPQVHIVAYCGDLGYGVAHGAEMLSVMLAFGIVSRIGSGFLADRIGGIRTLLIGSAAQGFALLFYLFFDSLFSLYVVSAMFGLFQGGIVPSYAIIVREYLPASRGRDPRRHRDSGVRGRDVVRRLGVRRDLRRHRLLRRGVPQRARLERAQRHHRDGAVAARAAAAGAGVSSAGRLVKPLVKRLARP